MRHRLALGALALANTAALLGGTAALALVAEPATQAPAPVVRAGAQLPPVALAPVAPTRRAVAPVVRIVRAPRKPAVRPVPRPTVTRRPVVLTAPLPATATLTPQQLMDRAIARIPGYRTGVTRWVISSKYGHWGLAVLGGDVVYVSPDVPSSRMYDVVAHEWSHMLSVADYGGSMPPAVAAMNAFFGGSGTTGAEIAADCMAKELGASWTHYTSCTNATWRAGARRLLAGQQL